MTKRAASVSPMRQVIAHSRLLMNLGGIFAGIAYFCWKFVWWDSISYKDFQFSPRHTSRKKFETWPMYFEVMNLEVVFRQYHKAFNHSLATIMAFYGPERF